TLTGTTQLPGPKTDTAAFIALAVPGANNDLKITAKNTGAIYNSVKISFVNTGAVTVPSQVRVTWTPVGGKTPGGTLEFDINTAPPANDIVNAMLPAGTASATAKAAFKVELDKTLGEAANTGNGTVVLSEKLTANGTESVATGAAATGAVVIPNDNNDL